jgi:hypothetical protein
MPLLIFLIYFWLVQHISIPFDLLRVEHSRISPKGKKKLFFYRISTTYLFFPLIFRSGKHKNPLRVFKNLKYSNPNIFSNLPYFLRVWMISPMFFSNIYVCFNKGCVSLLLFKMHLASWFLLYFCVSIVILCSGLFTHSEMPKDEVFGGIR